MSNETTRMLLTAGLPAPMGSAVSPADYYVCPDGSDADTGLAPDETQAL